MAYIPSYASLIMEEMLRNTYKINIDYVPKSWRGPVSGGAKPMSEEKARLLREAPAVIDANYKEIR